MIDPFLSSAIISVNLFSPNRVIRLLEKSRIKYKKTDLKALRLLKHKGISSVFVEVSFLA